MSNTSNFPPTSTLSPSALPAHAYADSKALSIRAALKDQVIFVTGATGFVGKCLVEKIVRSAPEFHKIYLLVRPKKGAAVEARVHDEILSSPCFDRCRSEIPNFEQWVSPKLVAVPGELTQGKVGLSPALLQMVLDTASVFFHCAAVVDFNERIDRAVELNVHGTLRLFDIAKQCRNLRAFVHVSTCYVNSNRTGAWVDEKLYDLGFDPEQALKRVEKMSVSELEKATLTGLLGDWPNTYTFTKAITEHLLVRNRGHAPLVIVRPSIIGAARAEPMPGWVDVISAAGALIVSCGMGVLKFLPGNPNNIGDVVPVDYVVNSVLACVPAVFDQVRFVCSSSSPSLSFSLPLSLSLSPSLSLALLHLSHFL